MLCKPLPFAVDARTRPGIDGWLRIRRSFGGCLCVCVEVCFRLSLSPYLSLSFQRSIAKPGTASSASTSSSSGCTRRCYFYPSRDASASAIFSVGLVEVGLTEEKTVGSLRGGGAGTCQNKTNQPGGKE